jgi:beta-lactam-binding protein with PASTA domain
LALDERLHREEVVHPDSIQYVVPRLDGYSKDDAFVLLDQMKLRYDTEGKGTTIESQEPKAGTRIARRDKIVLTLTGGAP